jgi:23S rRNA (guanosine2251-2'-O)-methyltransferase
MAGGVSSLNVSAAGAVVLYEAARQRRVKMIGVQGAVGAVGLNVGAASKKKQKGLGS